jgi:hypothetical protein
MAVTVPLASIRKPTKAYNAAQTQEHQVAWHWPCPICGVDVISPVTENASRKEIAADGRCYSCRKRNRI